MVRTRTCCVALGIFGLCLSASALVAMAQTAGAQQAAGVQQTAGAQQRSAQGAKKPGLFDQLVQQVITQITTAKPNPTLKLNADTTTPVTGQVISATAIWSQPVTNALYTFDWGDGSGQSVQGPNSQRQHVYTKAGNFVASVRATATFDGRSVPGTSRTVFNVALAPEVVPPPTTVVPQPEKPATVTLHADPQSTLQGRAIEFTVSVDPPTRLRAFHYYFGDGTDIVATNGIAHTYDLAGTHSSYVVAESVSGAPAITSASIPIVIRSAALPRLTLTASTTTPITGRELGVSATLLPAERPMRYRFSWGDGSPISIVDALGDGRHTYTSSGRYVVIVFADLARNSGQLSITSSPLPLEVHRPLPLTVTAISVAGLAVLASLSYFLFRPKVSATYRSTTWDAPAISVADAPHLAVSFRPGERASEQSVRILKEP